MIFGFSPVSGQSLSSFSAVVFLADDGSAAIAAVSAMDIARTIATNLIWAPPTSARIFQPCDCKTRRKAVLDRSCFGIFTVSGTSVTGRLLPRLGLSAYAGKEIGRHRHRFQPTSVWFHCDSMGW